MDVPEPQPYAAEVRLARAAAAAGERQLQERGSESQVLEDAGRDIKTTADEWAEEAIISVLRGGGTDAILSEETAAGPGDSKRFWVVDPLDGTLNFTRDIPLTCISIALWEDDRPVLGLIRALDRDETFLGVPGAGAWCGHQAIRVSDVSAPEKAVLATGFPTYRDFGPGQIEAFVDQVRAFKKVRLLGSAALSLAWLACGRIDAYAEDDIMLWDVAAGIALVEAAGGHVSVAQSPRHEWGRIVRAASSPGLWEFNS